MVRTLSRMAGDDVMTMAPDVLAGEDMLACIDKTVSCVVVQTPDVFGNLRDLNALAAKCHENGALLIAVFTEAVSLGLIDAAGRRWAPTLWSARANPSAMALNFGGPYVGLFATRQKYVRQMPGRLAGQTAGRQF